MARPAKFTEATAQTMLDYLARTAGSHKSHALRSDRRRDHKNTLARFLRWLERGEAGDPKYMVSWPPGALRRDHSPKRTSLHVSSRKFY